MINSRIAFGFSKLFSRTSYHLLITTTKIYRSSILTISSKHYSIRWYYHQSLKNTIRETHLLGSSKVCMRVAKNLIVKFKKSWWNITVLRQDKRVTEPICEESNHINNVEHFRSWRKGTSLTQRSCFQSVTNRNIFHEKHFSYQIPL